MPTLSLLIRTVDVVEDDNKNNTPSRVGNSSIPASSLPAAAVATLLSSMSPEAEAPSTAPSSCTTTSSSSLSSMVSLPRSPPTPTPHLEIVTTTTQPQHQQQQQQQHPDPRMNKALKLLIDNPCLTGLNEAMQAAGFSSDSVDMQRLEWIVSSAYRSLSPSHHHYHHHTITMSDIGNNVPSSITEDVYYGTTGTTTSTTTTSQNDDSDQVLGGHAKANTNKPTDPSDVMHEEAESRRYSQPVEHEGKVGDGTVSNNSETYYYEQGNNGLSEYERRRMERIARNNARLAELFPDFPTTTTTTTKEEAKKKTTKDDRKTMRKSSVSEEQPRRQLPKREKRAVFSSTNSKGRADNDEVLLGKRRRTTTKRNDADDDDDETTDDNTATTMPSINKRMKFCDDRFSQHCDDLKRYKKEHGDCVVPYQYEANRPLAAWVSNQRHQYKLFMKNEPCFINSNRIRLLEEIGFEFTPPPVQSKLSRGGSFPVYEAMFRRHYDDLKRYKKEHGDCLVPYQYEVNRSLAAWVKHQRHQYRLFMKNKPCITNANRIRLLEEIGFEFTPSSRGTQELWDCQFNVLQKFKNANGHCYVPRNHPENPSLGIWVSYQRKYYSLMLKGQKSCLTAERIQRLNEIGFPWSGRV